MTLRILIFGMILSVISGCNDDTPTFSYDQVLREHVKSAGTAGQMSGQGHSILELAVKLDRAPHNFQSNTGMAYYRLEISNPGGYRLSVNKVIIEFIDDFGISVQNCRVKGRVPQEMGNVPVWIDPGSTFVTNGNCEFPISQIDQVDDIQATVSFNFWQ